MRTTILILAAAASLRGQIPSGKLIAEVPFAFHQGASTMPAGRYELKKGPSGAVRVANPEAGVTAVSLFTKRIAGRSGQGFLGFRCYGESNKCFLREIAAPGSAVVMMIGPGKVEKEYASYGTTLHATRAPLVNLVE